MAFHAYYDINSLNRARVRLVNTRTATHIQTCSAHQALFMARVYKWSARRAEKRKLVDQARRWREYARGYLARACEVAYADQRLARKEGS